MSSREDESTVAPKVSVFLDVCSDDAGKRARRLVRIDFSGDN